jgi:hypothetical protein
MFIRCDIGLLPLIYKKFNLQQYSLKNTTEIHSSNNKKNNKTEAETIRTLYGVLSIAARDYSHGRYLGRIYDNRYIQYYAFAECISWFLLQTLSNRTSLLEYARE